MPHEFSSRNEELLREMDRNTQRIVLSMAAALISGSIVTISPTLCTIAFACATAAFVLTLRADIANHRDYVENSRLWHLRICHKIDQWQAAKRENAEWGVGE